MDSLPPALEPLADWPQFVTYRLVPSARAGKMDKRPCDWRTGNVASAHDPAMWGTFEECARNHQSADQGHGSGVGFVFTAEDPFWFLDIDGALQDDGKWSPLALELRNTLASCAVEVSQSQRGLHIIGTGVVPNHGCKNIPLGLEFYHEKRFVALTGMGTNGNASADASDALAQIIAQYFPPGAASNQGPDDWTTEPVPEWGGPVDDDDLIRRALAASDRSPAAAFGDGTSGTVTFRDLWECNETALSARWPSGGANTFDTSSADASLATRLAFWTGKNCERIRDLMRRSALVREKWEREDYLTRTIQYGCSKSNDVAKGMGKTAVPLSPDMTVINAGRRDPVPMPSDLFGPAWPLLSDMAEGTASPVDYTAISYLAAAASLIGGKRYVRPYATSNWKEPCILWCAAVGDPSTRKSPALDAVIGPLRLIEQDNDERFRKEVSEWESQSAVAKAARDHWQDQLKQAAKAQEAAPPMPPAAAELNEPSRRRTLVMDATPEAVGAILAENPQGTMHFRDELAGWLTSFDRYSPGGRAFWIEAYGGRPFTVDRKGAQKPLIIPFNGVTVLGGIQPAKLAESLLDAPDDGLTARFLWAWPDKVSFHVPERLANQAALETVYRRLDSLAWAQDANGQQTALIIPLSTTAAGVFASWQAENELIEDDSGSLFKSFVGKMDGAVLRLALIGELTRWAFGGEAEPQEVSIESLVAATAFVDDYAKPMALRVFGDAALPAAERNAAVLARYIRKHGLTRINKRELKRSPHKSQLPALRNASAMDAAIEVLVDSGWLSSAEAALSGRPRGDYLVDPGVHESDK